MFFSHGEVHIMGSIYTDAQKKASAKYLKEKRDKLTLNLPLGSKQRFKDYAESKGKTLTRLIIDLIENEIENDKNIGR